MPTRPKDSHAAGSLAIDIMKRGYHQPLVDGKVNRERVHNCVIRDIYSGKVDYVITEDIVELSMDVIDDLIEKQRRKREQQ